MSEQQPRYDVPLAYGASNPYGMAPEEEPKVGAWGAIFKVLWAPREVFTLVRNRAPVAAPYLFAMLISVVSIILASFVFPKFMDAMMQSRLPAGADATVVEATKHWTAIMFWVGGMFGALAGPWIMGLFWAIFLMLFGLFLKSEQRATFAQYFSAAGYLRIPALIGMILGFPLYFMVQSAEAFQRVPYMLTLANLAGNGSIMQEAVLSQVGPMVIWEFVLAAVALAVLNRKRIAQSAWIAGVLYVLNVLAVALFSSIGDAFQKFGQKMQNQQK